MINIEFVGLDFFLLQIKDAQTRVNLIFAQPEAARTILETAKGKVKRNPISWIPSFPQIDFICLIGLISSITPWQATLVFSEKEKPV